MPPVSTSPRHPFVSLSAGLWLIGGTLFANCAAAQSEPWVVEVTASSGSLGADAARPVIEAARSAIADCTDGPGPHRFDYTVSLRTNGQVREAAYDRGATSDPRAARCIRHALLELHFPAHTDAGTLALTLRAGAFDSAAPTTPPTAPSPTAPPPTAPPPTTAPQPSAPPVVQAPAPIATPAPTPIPIPIPTPRDPEVPAGAADVSFGAIGATPERTAAQLLSVITPQRASLVACYATARSADAALAGDATLHLTVSADGHVTSAMFQGSEAIASALASCVGQAARAWVFGAASAEARISVPLTFGAARPVRR